MYELHKLGWHSFQQLCVDIAEECLGQTVETFVDSNDGGRDGAFRGMWRSQQGEDLQGSFVIQCKFTAKPNGTLSLANLKDELNKAKRLVKAGFCDSYILMTNAGVSGRQSEAIQQSLQNTGVKHTRVFGGTWISKRIQNSARLRALVPRVYGLGDLTQILDERAYAQARALLSALSDDLAKVVITSSYRKAAAALESHRFVLLVGEPAAGKTTIASLLAMAALDQWKAPTLKVDGPEPVLAHWNPEEPAQLFWVDDAFGVTPRKPRKLPGRLSAREPVGLAGKEAAGKEAGGSCSRRKLPAGESGESCQGIFPRKPKKPGSQRSCQGIFPRKLAAEEAARASFSRGSCQGIFQPRKLPGHLSEEARKQRGSSQRSCQGERNHDNRGTPGHGNRGTGHAFRGCGHANRGCCWRAWSGGA